MCCRRFVCITGICPPDRVAPPRGDHQKCPCGHPVPDESCLTLCDPMGCGPPGFSGESMGFSRQEDWSGLPCPPAGIFLTQGSNSRVLYWQADALPAEPSGKPKVSTALAKCPPRGQSGPPVGKHCPKLTGSSPSFETPDFSQCLSPD